MIKLIENIFFTKTNAHKAFLPGPNINPVDIYSRNESGKLEVRNANGDYGEVKTSIDENDWSSLNFMQWFVKEKADEELYPTGNPDNIKIAGDGKTRIEASNSSNKDPANKPNGERFLEGQREK